MYKKIIATISIIIIIWDTCLIYNNININETFTCNTIIHTSQIFFKTPQQIFDEKINEFVKLKLKNEQTLRLEQELRDDILSLRKEIAEQEESKIEQEQEISKKNEEQENLNKITHLDRGTSSTYNRINVTIDGSWYTNADTELEGGKYDKRGKLLTSHNMPICAVPKDIPYGSLLEYDGVMYLCCDTGGSIIWKNNGDMKVDFFYPDVTSSWLENNLKPRKGNAILYIKNN